MGRRGAFMTQKAVSHEHEGLLHIQVTTDEYAPDCLL